MDKHIFFKTLLGMCFVLSSFGVRHVAAFGILNTSGNTIFYTIRPASGKPPCKNGQAPLDTGKDVGWVPSANDKGCSDRSQYSVTASIQGEELQVAECRAVPFPDKLAHFYKSSRGELECDSSF